jgi:4a-hydroxytetrahydrobiopterin dehydratase
MEELSRKKCKPCEGKTKPLTTEEAEKYLESVPEWRLSEDKKTISRVFSLPDFVSSINFVNDIAHLAEEEGHHPDILIRYATVRCNLTTHAIHGLSDNDFIMAAKIDELLEDFTELEK